MTMKSLFLIFPILIFAITTSFANENSTQSQQKRAKFLDGASIFDGKVNPEEMPKYALMSAFMRDITDQSDIKYGPIRRKRMLNEIGLTKSSIAELLHIAAITLEEDQQMNKSAVVCDYMKAKGKTATKADLAKLINDHEWAMRQIFADVYNELEHYMSVNEAEQLRDYLSETFVLNLYYVRKDIQSNEVNLQRASARCSRKHNH